MNLLQRLPPSTFQVSIPMLLVLATMSFGVYRAIDDASAALASYVPPQSSGGALAPPQYIIEEHLLSQQALRAPAEPQREGRRPPDPDAC